LRDFGSHGDPNPSRSVSGAAAYHAVVRSISAEGEVMTMKKKELDEFREHYDNTSLPESVDRSTPDDQTVDEVMVSTSIRLPRSLMQQVRQQAEAAGMPATTLIRQWVIDRIGASKDDAVVTVADLERFIAERSHPAA
jgi:predicted DNA binding CopG/RHH family protein